MRIAVVVAIGTLLLSACGGTGESADPLVVHDAGDAAAETKPDAPTETRADAGADSTKTDASPKDTGDNDTGEPDDTGTAEDTSPPIDTGPPCTTTPKATACAVAGTSALTGKPWVPCGPAADDCGGAYDCGSCTKAEVCVSAPGKKVGVCGCYALSTTVACTTKSGAAGQAYECPKSAGPFVPLEPDCRVTYDGGALVVVGWCCPK